jgi:hypothetical protein
MALEQFPSTVPVTVVFVRLTTIGAAMEGTGAPDKSAPAWAVRLIGSFYDAHLCGPDELTPPQCGPHPTTALAVIAVRTGEMWGAMPAP